MTFPGVFSNLFHNHQSFLADQDFSQASTGIRPEKHYASA